MSAIKPWGKAALVGSTVGSLALGIGCRCRETIVDIVEKKMDPSHERANMNRCILSDTSVRLLEDLGMTRRNLDRVLRPAKKWKFVTHALDTMREGEAYSGVAPAETAYHVAEGKLIRVLRQDFSRFGGALNWQTEALDPFPSGDESQLWSLRKEWGTLHELHFVGNFAKSNVKHFNPKIFDERQRIPNLLFNSTRGWTDKPPLDLLGHFGTDYDLIMVLGREVAMNVWRCSEDGLAWQLVSQASPNPEREKAHQKQVNTSIEEFHPSLRTLMSLPNKEKFINRHDLVRIPLDRPKFHFEDENSVAMDDHRMRRMVALQDTVIPVDAFGWRGDNAAHAISEASALCSKLFSTGRQFHRGDLPHELRQFELDSLERRFQLAAGRDLRDAELFLSVNPELPREDDEEPEAARVAE